MNDRLSLSELNGQVKTVLSANFTAPVWVVGEISEINVHSNGHCYLMLIEKGDSEDRIVAQARATIWSYTFRMLRPFFETTTGQQLTEGIKVLLQVSVEFHELYGFSLNVRNIDPTYTLGDQARKRREIIKRLTDEGVLTMNKELELPLVPQKIAIISSPNAAGYEDFMEQLTANPNGFHFYTQLFPATMQGNQAEQSIIDALDRIYPFEDFFDLVVIIRGGGSQVDLSCFDNYNVAYHVTQFPIPVLTGIGHEKDDSIVDLVAHTRLKTPTAVAGFIIDGVIAFAERIDLLEQQAVEMIEDKLLEEKSRIEVLTREISSLIRNLLDNKRNELLEKSWKSSQAVRLSLQNREYQLAKKLQRTRFFSERYFYIRNQKILQSQNMLQGAFSRAMSVRKRHLEEYLQKFRSIANRQLEHENYKIEIADHKRMLMDPGTILKRGFTITTFEGRLVKDVALLKNEQTIKTHFYDGSVRSKVIEITKTDKDDK
ncbi:MAG TPA: exodeoxyribonuclease VII large subunit [Prolixibacteraceae bacterium]